METGYFFLCDILGFSRIVENLDKESLDAQIETWVSLVHEASEKNQITRYQLLSDTLFASAGQQKDDLIKLIRFSQYLLEKGTEKSLPIRGAISYGDFNWGQLIYGKSVIDCHTLESKQQWIGIGCTLHMPHAEQLWSTDKLVCYPVPLSSGGIRLHPVVAWDIPDTETIIRNFTDRGLTKKGEVLGWQWAHKIENTIKFRLYLKALIRDKQEPKNFYGLLPIQAIEMLLNMKV